MRYFNSMVFYTELLINQICNLYFNNYVFYGMVFLTGILDVFCALKLFLSNNEHYFCLIINIKEINYSQVYLLNNILLKINYMKPVMNKLFF